LFPLFIFLRDLERNGDDGALESIVPCTSNTRSQLTQSYDTIKNLEEEKKKFQDSNEIQESNNNLNEYKSLYDDLKKKYDGLIDENKENKERLNDMSDTIDKFEEEKKRFQQEIQESNNNLNEYKSLYDDLKKKYDGLIEENKENKERLNDMSDTIDKFEEEKKKFQQEIQESNNNLNEYKTLYDDLKKKYDGLVDENKERLNDMSDTIKKLEEEKKKFQDDIQEYDNNFNNYISLYDNLREKYVELTNKNYEETNQNQKLKNEIHQINDINQQYMEKLQDLEKEKEELDERNYNLYYQLLDDDDYQNHALNLNNDITELNDNLKKYITDLNQNVIINMEEVKKLLLFYKCPTKITNQKDDRLLIQAVLQRHIIETIFSYATKYFQMTGQHYHLESDIINKTSSLYILLTKISKQRTGNEEVTHLASTKLRQQIYSILNNHGFGDIIGDSFYEHPFIVYYKEQLNKIMNELRIINDDQEKSAAENLAATIIREFIKIFWFRLKVQDPVVQYSWIPHDTKVDKTLMEGINFSDNENLYVALCYFPLTGRDLASNNRKIYTPAKVFIRKD
jgi:DNA repair exonuclease SbcCD ATPase subunit